MKTINKFQVTLLLAISILTAWRIDKTSFLFKKMVHVSYFDSSSKNILPQVLALNSNLKSRPSTEFRKGIVSRTSIENYLSKTSNGYCIQLPSNTNIPTPAVINGSLYLSGGFGSRQYYAFDAVSGKNKWAINLDDDGPSSPAIADGVIVFNTESCTIFACDMVTGKPIWSYFLGDPLMSMPTIANGIVFTSYPAQYNIDEKAKRGADDFIPTHVLIAIELKTGKILWQKWIDSDIMSAPVAKDDLLYVASFSGAMYKVKQRTGEIIEAKAMKATSAPVFGASNEIVVSRRTDDNVTKAVGESVVIGYGTEEKSVYKKEAKYLDKKVQSNSKLKTVAVNADAGNGFSAGAPASSNYMAAYDNIGQSNVSSLQSFQGSRALYRSGRLYNTMGDEIICTDSNGDVKWKHKLDGDMNNEGGYMGTPPVYANGHIIVATLNGEVLIFEEKNGTLTKKYEVKDPIRYQPVVDNGWIYVTTVNSKLYAINTGDATITGWNMWGANPARTNEK